MKNRNAMILGGGAWQVPLIKFIKQKGWQVTVVDPLKDCVGSKFADKHVQINARDFTAIANQFKPGEFAMVASDQSDMATPAVAQLSQKWGLPGNRPEAVEKFNDKTKCREFAATLGLPQPAFLAAHNLNEVLEFVRSREGACIIKPADSQSSRGVTKISGISDSNLPRAFESALSHSTSGKVIVEDFIVGSEITVEGLCSGGRHRCFAASIKEHFRTAIAKKLLYPMGLPENMEADIFKTLDRFVEASGLSFGITHAELIVDLNTQRHWLVEIACRGGGTLISSDIAPWVSGVNFYEVLYAGFTGEAVDVMKFKRLKRGALLGFFEFRAGRVKKIHGWEEMLKIPGVHQAQLDFKAGDTIKAAADDRGRQGFAILFGETSAEVETLWKKINTILRVEVG